MYFSRHVNELSEHSEKKIFSRIEEKSQEFNRVNQLKQKRAASAVVRSHSQICKDKKLNEKDLRTTEWDEMPGKNNAGWNSTKHARKVEPVALGQVRPTLHALPQSVVLEKDRGHA